MAEITKNSQHFDHEILDVYKSFFFASEMEEGAFFEINISASDNVKVKVGNVGRGPFGETITTNPIFEDYGRNIVQRINVTRKDTYQVEIVNEGVEPITLSGALSAKKTVRVIETLHPYASLGTLVLLAGLGVLTYGFLAKPRKGRARKRSIRF